MKICIVADDLTGAADSVAPFADIGLHSRVVVGRLPDIQAMTSGCTAIAISTETRDIHMEQESEVRNAIRGATNDLLAIWPPDILCKKIDSTLRGQLDVELSALHAAFPGRTPLICPAYPSQGRVVRENVLHVEHEPRCIVKEAFGSAYSSQIEVIGLKDIRRGRAWVRRRLQAAQHARAVFFDAETDDDLRSVAADVCEFPGRWLPVGSAGLMSAIAAEVATESGPQQRMSPVIERCRYGSVLFLVGSRNHKCRLQVQALLETAGIEPAPTISEALRQMDCGSRLAVAATPLDEQDGVCVLENLLLGSKAILSKPCLTVVATGGATASALLTTETASFQLDILGQLEAGVVAADLLATNKLKSTGNIAAPTMHLILKAGGFGDHQTLVRCAGL